jgi:hypothetical protein
MERWLPTKAERLKRLRWARADLRRCLRMHRRLAIGMALAAAAVEAIWLFAWQLKAYGPHGLRAAANPTAITVYAALLMLAPAAVGLIAAIAARNLDQRIYDGTDVESLLGVAPMGELPDFAEAPGEYSEVDLLRLANGIAHSCKRGRTRRCVFTGTGHGAGVTTLALRVKQSLDILDRPTMLVDAAGAPHPAVAPSAEALQSAGLSGDWESGESGKRRDELVITDAEPIASSPDTEYLARFADCVLVVIESGVTTRAELRRTVSCLEKLNAVAVQYVVNRIKQAYSGRSLSESVAALGVAPGQFAAAVRRAVADAPIQNEKRAPTQRTTAESRKPAKAPDVVETAITKTKRAEESSAWNAPEWNAPGIPTWLSAALVQLEAEEGQRPAGGERATPAGAKSSNQAGAAKSSEHGDQMQEALPFEDHLKGKESHQSEAEAMLFSMDLNRSMRENGPMTPAAGAENLPTNGQGAEKQDLAAEKKPSRLSGLRGMVTAAELRALNQQPKPAEATRWPVAEAQQPVPPSLIEALTETPGRLSGLKGLVAHADLKELNQGRPEAQVRERDAMEPEPRIVEVAQASRLEPKPTEEIAIASESPDSAKTKAKTDAVPSKPPESERSERNAKFDEIQILPSRRGQYGRKK